MTDKWDSNYWICSKGLENNVIKGGNAGYHFHLFPHFFRCPIYPKSYGLCDNVLFLIALLNGSYCNRKININGAIPI